VDNWLIGWLVSSHHWPLLLAGICAIVGMTFLGGITRDSLFDRETLAGGLLVGLALLVHGGFESSPYLSPQSSYRGFVGPIGADLGKSWKSIPNDTWIFVDGSLYHPYGDDPSRWLHLVWADPNAPPESLLRRDYRYDLTFVYRSWDLRVISINALPDPYIQESGLAPWHWFAPSAESRWYSLVEAGFGAIALISSIGLPLYGSSRALARARKLSG
jgi:hypothetical protein